MRKGSVRCSQGDFDRTYVSANLVWLDLVEWDQIDSLAELRGQEILADFLVLDDDVIEAGTGGDLESGRFVVVLLSERDEGAEAAFDFASIEVGVG